MGHMWGRMGEGAGGERIGRPFRLERITPHHYSFETAWGCIDLRYEIAGFQSGWTILRDGAVLGHRADLMNALDAAVRWSWATAPDDFVLRARVSATGPHRSTA